MTVLAKKIDMLRDLSARTGLTQRQIESLQEEYGRWALEQLQDGRTVLLPGLGRLNRKTIPPRRLSPAAFGDHRPGALTRSRCHVILSPSTQVLDILNAD